MTSPDLAPLIETATKLNEAAMREGRQTFYVAKMRSGRPTLAEIKSFPVTRQLDRDDVERIVARYLPAPGAVAKPKKDR